MGRCLRRFIDVVFSHGDESRSYELSLYIMSTAGVTSIWGVAFTPRKNDGIGPVTGGCGRATVYRIGHTQTELTITVR